MSVKNAAGLPPGAKAMPSDRAVSPAQPVQTQTGLGRQRVQTEESRPTQEEKQQVIRMQSIMMALGQAMDKDRVGMAQKLGIRESDIATVSGLIQDTGGDVSGSLDGKWGDKTIAALRKIAELSKIAKTSVINPGKNYKQVHPGNVVDLAKANVDAIAELMQSVGFGAEVPGNIGVRPERYDVVPESLAANNIREILPAGDGRGIQPKDLDNIWTFYHLASSLMGEMPLPNAQSEAQLNSLEKLAEIIKEASIIRVSQVAQKDDGFEEAFKREMAKSKVPVGMTAAKFEAALNWFYNRASFILSRAQDRMFYEDDSGKIVGSKEEVKNASDYRAAIDKLRQIWLVQKDDIIQGRNPADVPLSREDLKQIKDPKAYAESRGKRDSQTGLGRLRQTDKGQREQISKKQINDSPSSKDDGFRIFRKAPSGILGPEIDLVPIMGDIPNSNSLQWLRENSDDLSFSYEGLRKSFGNLDNVVESYRANPSYPKKRFAVHLFHHLFQVVDDAYDIWKDGVKAALRSGIREYDEDSLKKLLDTQSGWAEAWRTLLNRKKNQAADWDIPMYDKQGNPLE